jgi:predicted acylesterase/phospholipase RssA
MKPGLALGGGGCKAYVQCAICAEIERRSGNKITDLFSIIAGTSAGGINALSFESGHSAEETLSFYTSDASDIFKVGLFTSCMAVLRGYRFDPGPLEAALQKRFGNAKLIDCPTPLIVTAYDRNTKAATFFKSFDPNTQQYQMWQVGRATSAAEYTFPPFKLNNWSLWDGGTIANSPSVCLLAQAVSLWGWQDDFRVLFLGCGSSTASPVPECPGAIQTGEELAEALTEGSDELSAYQATQFLGNNYSEIEPIGITTSLSDASPEAIAQLNAIALDTIKNNSDLIDSFCK